MQIRYGQIHTLGLTRWLNGKESACTTEDTGDAGLTPGSGRSPGEGNGNSLQYSCLKNPMDRGACPCGRQESDTTEHTVETEIGLGILYFYLLNPATVPGLLSPA